MPVVEKYRENDKVVEVSFFVRTRKILSTVFLSISLF